LTIPPTPTAGKLRRINAEYGFKKIKSGVPGIGPEFRVAVIKEQQQNTSKSE
jgi:hypothetical protein